MTFNKHKILLLSFLFAVSAIIIAFLYPAVYGWYNNYFDRGFPYHTEIDETGFIKIDSIELDNNIHKSKFYNTDLSLALHRTEGVGIFEYCFPDTQSVQIVAAEMHGISSVANREDAENRKKELVFVQSNPYYAVNQLSHSIPYLVPRAAILLQDIGKAYADSLFIKGMPLQRIVVTSILRTEEDVLRLRRYNRNATEKSCHMYGTTFDISYNRYSPLIESGLSTVRWGDIRNKLILAEVLRDFREQGKCYVKYEVHQGCFHITVR